MKPCSSALALLLLMGCAPAAPVARAELSPLPVSPAPVPVAQADLLDGGADARTRVDAPVVVDRGTLPCGDLGGSAAQGISPVSTSAGAVRFSWTSSGELFATVTVHGTFAVPSHTATSSSSHTQLASTRGFVERAGRFIEIGELARGQPQLAKGRGVPVIAADDGSLLVCRTGAHANLPPSPHARLGNLLALRVDGASAFAVYAEYAPRGATCKRLTSGVTLARLFVDRIDLDAPAPAWTTITTRSVARPPGKGCRGTFAASAEIADLGGAVAIATESCTFIDAGDSISSSDCSLSIESWASGRWETSALATQFRTPKLSVLLSVEKDVTSVAVNDEGLERTQVYRKADASLVPQGSDFEGMPVALLAGRLVSWDAKGMKPGSNGAGYRFTVHSRSGDTWTALTDPFEVTSAHGASATMDSGEVIVGVADRTTDAGPIHVEVLRTQGRTWQPLAAFDVRVSM